MKLVRSKYMRLSGIVAGLCVLAVTGVFLIFSVNRSSYEPLTDSYQEKFAYWKMRAHAIGGERAYEELLTSLEKFPAGLGHEETHIFASALYSEVGLQGVKVCDVRIGYGCFHQIIGEAVVDLGVAALPEIIEACNGDPSCRHSIGHGVLGLQGYSSNDLQNAIKLCETLPSKLYIQGCYGGVFMEYNMRSLLEDDPRARVIEADWLDPCSQFSGKMSRVCSYWQPVWWRSVLVSNDQSLTPSILSRMGQLCRSLKEKESRAACIQGVGMSALNAGPTNRDGISACAFVSPDRAEQALCHANVARLITLQGRFDEARAACTELSGTYRAGCFEVVESANPYGSTLGEMLPIEKYSQ